jgi:mono/diheme cytochrome c family protein
VTSRIRFALPLLLLLLGASLPAHALSSANDKAATQAGATLFGQKGCAHCHGEAGVGGKKGPSLTNLRKDKEWTPARMTNQILNGGQKMPSFSDSLTDTEVAQLVTYLRARHKPASPPVSARQSVQPAQ